jgi:acetoin utilization protein AcuB
MEQRAQVQSSTARPSVQRPPGPTTVGDVMSTKVKSLSPDASVEEAMAVFEQWLFRHLVVVDADGRLAGVVSDRDVLRQAAKGGTHRATKVKDLMTREVATATPHMGLKTAIDIVVFKKINCLPVLDGGGEVCGIITTTDLLAGFHEMLSRG